MTAQGQGGGRLRGTNTTSPSGKAREGGGCGGGGKVLEGFGSMGKGGQSTREGQVGWGWHHRKTEKFKNAVLFCPCDKNTTGMGQMPVLALKDGKVKLIDLRSQQANSVVYVIITAALIEPHHKVKKYKGSP